MTFLEWLESESAALDRLDAMERGEVPPGPIEFRKANGEPFLEFVQLAKDNGDGSRTTIICNAGGWVMKGAEAVDAGDLADMVAEAVGAVNELSKRVDALSAAQADLIEVGTSEIVNLFAAAADEALLAAGG